MVTPRMLRLAVVALLLGLTIPRMAQRGMFGDGLVYATIARNLASGVGSFWAPAYTRTAWAEFFEHPPLGLGLEALAFWLLGDHLIVERLFALIVCGLHALVIAALWRRTQPEALDWLPMLFWLAPSIVTWGVVNNMLENTQALFTSTAVLLLVDAARAPTAPAPTVPAIVARSAAAGVAVVAAVLTKGPVGFFPLATPLLFGASTPTVRGRRTRRLIVITLAAVVGVSALALATYGPSRRNITMYVMTHLAPTLQGQRDVSHPLAIVRHLVVGIIGRMTALLVLCWWLGRRLGSRGTTADADGEGDTSEGPRDERWNRSALGFLALGLCAAVPIAISPKVSGHYLLPSVPLFALGFASLARQFITPPRTASSPRLGRVSLAAAMLATILIVTIAASAATPRDAAMLRDLDAIDAAMPRGLTIGACRHPRSTRDWGLHTYVQRWYRVSLDAADVPRNGWLLQADDSCTPPSSCVAVARGDELTLFRCDRTMRQASE